MSQVIIDKVKKILAKVGRGASEAEAQTAIAMAQRLLEQHNITMAEVDAPQSEFVEEVAWDGSREPAEAVFIANILQGHFFVSLTTLKIPGTCNRYYLFGERANIEVSKWIWHRLTDQYRSLFRSYRISNRAPASERKSYYCGLTDGLSYRLRCERLATVECASGGYELALRKATDRLNEAFGIHYPTMKPAKTRSIDTAPTSYFEGRADSDRLSVARPLGSNSSSPRPLAITDESEPFKLSRR